MSRYDRGPNLGILDLAPRLRDDPEFTTWTNPVPPDWFSNTRRSFILVDQEALYGSLTWARFFGRTALETLSAPSDAAVVGLRGFLRGSSDVVLVPAEAVATTRIFFRSASEIIPVATDSVQRITAVGGIVNPVIDTWP